MEMHHHQSEKNDPNTIKSIWSYDYSGVARAYRVNQFKIECDAFIDRKWTGKDRGIHRVTVVNNSYKVVCYSCIVEKKSRKSRVNAFLCKRSGYYRYLDGRVDLIGSGNLALSSQAHREALVKRSCIGRVEDRIYQEAFV